MSSMLEIRMNHRIILKYDRNTRLPGKQRQFLDIMDHDMDEGINLGDSFYEHPDIVQKAKYVAMQLAHGIHNHDQGLIKATCAYLTNRIPSLQQININDSGEEVMINLHFDDANL